MNTQTAVGIELDSIVLEHGDGDRTVRALDDVSLRVAGGELVAIVGPSGAGKSSLLAVAGALASPTSGTVSVHGRALGDLSRRERTRFRLTELGFVFQSGNLVPALTVGISCDSSTDSLARGRIRSHAAARERRHGPQGRSSTA